MHYYQNNPSKSLFWSPQIGNLMTLGIKMVISNERYKLGYYLTIINLCKLVYEFPK